MALSGLIGDSLGFRTLLEKAKMVAAANCPVLIRGETGTGKEVIARTIHHESPRSRNRFVALNCAAIPASLVESELFGHERGAFTGAVTQTVGRFQAADRGTLFLDEVGDLPLELQPKLLRVLQEQEFERLGSGHTIRIDVRVIAATNQDLWRMVQAGEFRADLFYRLSVFPITVPPLRERMDDIPLLVDYFVQRFSERHAKSIRHIPEKLIEAIRRHSWPGNIRELQNFIERAVIMSADSVLRAPIEALEVSQAPPQIRTLKDAERAHILAALAETGWVIGGSRGAAARLDLPRTTLIAKMRKLGISRHGQPAEQPDEPETIPKPLGFGQSA